MNLVIDITKLILGKELPFDYSILFLTFVLFCVIFFIWSLYFIIKKGAFEELRKIEWYPMKDTFFTSINVVIFIVISSVILFSFDFVLNQLVSIIFNYAK